MKIPAKVRPLRREEIGTAAETLALAFDGDPLFRHLLPEDGLRAKWLEWLGRRSFGESFGANGAYTVEAGASAGVMALFPPGTWPPPAMTTFKSSGMLPALPTYRWVVEGLRLERCTKKAHPREPHLYLYMVGVHPSQKGRGIGGALLRHASALAREAGVVAHLETSNPDNLPLYRRFGYEVTLEIREHGGPPVWVMTTHA